MSEIAKEQMLAALAMLMLKEREHLRHNPEVKKKLEAIRALILAQPKKEK